MYSASANIHGASLVPPFFMLGPYSKIYKFHFHLEFLHIISHNDKGKNDFLRFLQFKKKKICISIHNLCHYAQNWAQVHPVSADHLHHQMFLQLDWNLPVVNSLTDHELEKHTPVCIRSYNWQYQCTKQAMKSKELSVDHWDRIVSRHREGCRNVVQHWKTQWTQWSHHLWMTQDQDSS